MKYIKAQNILPKEVIEIIQTYVDGECIYIPRKEGSQKGWGEKSGTRDSLSKRDRLIYSAYKDGASVSELSKTYFLSEQSIRRIISRQKQV